MIRRTVFAASLAVAALAAAPAQAHLASGRLGDFYGGVFHPLTGFEYLLPWLALTILAAFQGAHRTRWLFLVFPAGLLAGAATSVAIPALAFVPFANILLIAGIGLLVAWGRVLPFPVFLTFVTLTAFGQGYDNGSAITRETDPVLFIAGIGAVGYVFTTLLGGATLAFLRGTEGWRFIALRAAGSWIAAVGIMIVGFQLSRLST